MRGWTKVGAVLPGVLAGIAASCARLEHDPAVAVAPALPTVSAVDPQPGTAPADAKFHVQFSAAMDEGQLLASSGQSESVVLAAAADVERAAAAISHPRVTVEERALFVPAAAQIAADARSLDLTPAHPLAAGTYFLLVSPKVRDTDGRKLAGNGARFQYSIATRPGPPRLIAPSAGAETPMNLTRVLVHSDAGNVALVDDQGVVVAGPVAGPGDLVLDVRAPLVPSARYRLAVDDAPLDETAFTASACKRSAPAAVENGAARLSVRDTAVEVDFALDVPAQVELQVGGTADPCAGECKVARTVVQCAPSPCGDAAFVCGASSRIDGLQPGAAYGLRLVARDLQGFESRSAVQRFDTAAPLPRVLLSEVMASPPGAAPRSDGEYVEILNLGPGSAQLDKLALVGPDGVLRPLLAAPPPQPVMLAPGARALAVGAAFDATRYPALPSSVPLLHAATQKLLGTGLRDEDPPALRLIAPGVVPIDLASFPGGAFKCAVGVSIQRDETLPPDAQAGWRCGKQSGTPGLPP